MAAQVRLVLGLALLLEASLILASDAISKDRPPGSHTEIGKLVGSRSVVAHYCGLIGYVDLGAELDGPAYYFTKGDGRVIARCGGYCEVDPKSCIGNCPPKSWKCR